MCPGLAHRTVWCTTGQCPVHHRTVSGAPPDNVRCTRGLHAELLTFGKIQRRSAIIHRTVRCTPDSVRCFKEKRPRNSPASGILSAIIHRTCPVHTGLSGEPAEQRLLRANDRLQRAVNALQCAQKSEQSQKAHRTVCRTCPVHQRTVRWPRRQKLQRSNPNGRVTWLAHRTVSGGAPDCLVRLSTVASTKRLVWWLGL